MITKYTLDFHRSINNTYSLNTVTYNQWKDKHMQTYLIHYINVAIIILVCHEQCSGTNGSFYWFGPGWGNTRENIYTSRSIVSRMKPVWGRLTCVATVMFLQ